MVNFLIQKIKIAFCVLFFSSIIFSVSAADNKEEIGPDTTIDKVMCNAYTIFNGNLGKTFAVFAIVALGIGFFLGKVSWGTAIAVAVGVGAIFGAPGLVQTITGGTDRICSPTKG